MNLTNDAGKSYDVRFTFASLKSLHQEFKGEADTNGKKPEIDDEEMFDRIATGLAQRQPMVLLKTLYGGLAHMKVKPLFDNFFDDLSNVLLANPDELYTQVVAELNASGFFNLQIKHWKTIMQDYVDVSKAGIDKIDENKPSDKAKQETKDKYEKENRKQYNRFQAMYLQSTGLLEGFEELEKGTESGLSMPDQEQE